MSCPRCRSAATVEIRMQVHAERLTMHSCVECESRWWDRDGDVVSLADVLELAAA